MPPPREAISRRLLLVEDSPSDAALIRSLLDEVGGWELTHAATLQAAVGLLSRLSFDAVLLDLGLPDAHGIDGLHGLRRQFEVPVVVLTGRPEGQFGADAISLGAQDYLSKDSLDAEMLIRSVRHAMQRHAHGRKVELMQRRLRRYARAVAHDIRAPMSTIRGFAELIKVEESAAGRAGGRSAEYAERIIDQSKRLLDLASDLLAEPADDGTAVDVDLTATARWVEDVVDDQLQARGVLMTVTRLPKVSGDGTILRQVLLNLTSNALEHAIPPPAGGLLELRWSSQRREDGGWDVVLEDNGVEVDDALIDHGQPLPVVEVLPDADGHGLGLRVVAAGVAEHDGEVWLSRGSAGGLRVTIALPASRTAA